MSIQKKELTPKDQLLNFVKPLEAQLVFHRKDKLF